MANVSAGEEKTQKNAILDSSVSALTLTVHPGMAGKHVVLFIYIYLVLLFLNYHR